MGAGAEWRGQERRFYFSFRKQNPGQPWLERQETQIFLLVPSAGWPEIRHVISLGLSFLSVRRQYPP